jgi:hypothetical protein
VVLREPPFTLIIQRANVGQLKTFLKLLHLGSSSGSSSATQSQSLKLFAEELAKVNSGQQGEELFKRPTTVLTCKSKSEYLSHFKAATITQNNLKGTSSGLVKLVLTNCELKFIDPSLFDLVNLTHLDLSSNRLTRLNDFKLDRLEELNVSQNLISSIGSRIHTPLLVSLDMSHNRLTWVSKDFCSSFRSVSKFFFFFMF